MLVKSVACAFIRTSVSVAWRQQPGAHLEMGHPAAASLPVCVPADLMTTPLASVAPGLQVRHGIGSCDLLAACLLLVGRVFSCSPSWPGLSFLTGCLDLKLGVRIILDQEGVGGGLRAKHVGQLGSGGAHL